MTSALLRPLAELDLIARTRYWFYFVTNDKADIVRLLADAQDLPTILADVTHE